MTTSFVSSPASAPPFGWHKVVAASPDRYVPVSGAGRPATRVVVQPGDACGYTGERALATLMAAGVYGIFETPSSGTQFFAMSRRVDGPLQDYCSPASWGMTFDIHGPDTAEIAALSASAPVQFHVGSQSPGGPMLYSVLTNGGPVVAHQAPVRRQFAAHAAVRLGVWANFVLKVVFDAGASGALEVYRRDDDEPSWTLALSYAGPTLQYVPGYPVGAHYAHEGWYRGRGAGVTETLLLGATARAAAFADAEMAAFGASYPVPA